MKISRVGILIIAGLSGLKAHADQSNRVFSNSENLPGAVSAPALNRNTPLPALPSEDQLAVLVGDDDCPVILHDVADRDFTRLSPRLLAVVASCEPVGKDPEKMFLFAEKKDPKNESILLLHARYRTRKLAINADELWLKLKNMTSNEQLSALADEYLVGVSLRKTNPLELRPSSLYFSGSVATISETNPRALSNSDPNLANSSSLGIAATGASRISLDSAVGSVNLDYILSSTNYFNTPDVNLLAQDIDLPVIFQSTRELSFGFRPFASYYFLGGTQFYDRLGAAFMYTYEGDHFSHNFQAQVYQDAYFFNSFGSLGGTHYRGEYTARFRNEKLFNSQISLLVDHVNASEDISLTQDIPYSHSDSGVLLGLSHAFGKWTLGFSPQLYVRDDDKDSRYLNGLTGLPMSKRRQDFQTVLRGSISYALSKTFELIGSYEWNSIRSNMGPTDYLDRNSLDQTIGIQLKAGVNNVY